MAQSRILPGVHTENVIPVPSEGLRTGVPLFLGFLEVAHDVRGAEESDMDAQHVVDIQRNTASLIQRDFYLWNRPGANQADHGRSAGARRSGNGAASVETTTFLADVPLMFTLWDQFEERYRSVLEGKGYLYEAVRGFFANEGRICYVHIRALHPGEILEQVLASELDQLEALETIDLVCVPDLMWRLGGMAGTQRPLWGVAGIDGADDAIHDQVDTVAKLQNLILAHCDRAGNRFAILDPLPKGEREGARYLSDIRNQRMLLADTRSQGTNGALYFPWVRVGAESGQSGGFVPPCGHVAGVYARSDQRVGVFKAPANERLHDVIDLEYVPSTEEMSQLNSENINCLRVFRGRGIRVWGARTLDTNPQWRYVNVRRLFLTAVRWIDANMTDVAFEPHTPALWAQIERDLTIYFTDLYNLGAFSGFAPGEAFYVKCNAETNPINTIEQGHVITEIGLAAARPAEFIIIRIVHSQSGVALSGPS